MPANIVGNKFTLTVRRFDFVVTQQIPEDETQSNSIVLFPMNLIALNVLIFLITEIFDSFLNIKIIGKRIKFDFNFDFNHTNNYQLIV